MFLDFKNTSLDIFKSKLTLKYFEYAYASTE